jgi:RNase adapter protein RapZ
VTVTLEGPETADRLNDVVIVTGPAGAGRTTAIHALEDLGFEAVVNLPFSLLPRLFDGPPVGALAIGADPCTRGFSVGALTRFLDDLALGGSYAATLLYIDCSPRVLVHRYNETRRRHPSSPDSQPLIGIERESAMLVPLRARADVLIDTTMITPHDLKAEIARHFAGGAGRGELAVTLQSFSFKRGAPLGADMVMDLRFLRNPHWDTALRPLDGRLAAVADFIAEDPKWRPFMGRLEDMVRFLLPAYRAEGKAYFTLGIGCTGGRHRSVAAVEALAKTLADEGWRVSIHHRDLVESSGAAPEARAEVGAQ